MKYLKKYEELNTNEPKEGDYIICYRPSAYAPLANILNNIIGKIYKINQNGYHISYDPKDFLFQNAIKVDQTEPWLSLIQREDILYWSENKKDLDEILLQRKFNL